MPIEEFWRRHRHAGLQQHEKVMLAASLGLVRRRVNIRACRLQSDVQPVTIEHVGERGRRERLPIRRASQRRDAR